MCLRRGASLVLLFLTVWVLSYISIRWDPRAFVEALANKYQNFVIQYGVSTAVVFAGGLLTIATFRVVKMLGSSLDSGEPKQAERKEAVPSYHPAEVKFKNCVHYNTKNDPSCVHCIYRYRCTGEGESSIGAKRRKK